MARDRDIWVTSKWRYELQQRHPGHQAGQAEEVLALRGQDSRGGGPGGWQEWWELSGICTIYRWRIVNSGIFPALVVRFLTKRYIGEYDHQSDTRYKNEVLVDGDPVIFEICDLCPRDIEVSRPLISPDWSRDLVTILWLVQNNHVTCILASDWLHLGPALYREPGLGGRCGAGLLDHGEELIQLYQASLEHLPGWWNTSYVKLLPHVYVMRLSRYLT